MKLFGARVQRVEDPDLLRGRGCFVDDIHMAGTLHAVFARSPHAHARVRSIAMEKARAAPGVHGIFTLADLPPRLQTVPIPLVVPHPSIVQPWTQRVLTGDEVCYVGEPVAVVVAESRYAAEDAAGLLEVDYDPLPVVADCREGLKAGSPVAHRSAPDNVASRFSVGFGDAETAFRAAPHVFRETLSVHRGGGQALECRGVLARYDPVQDLLTLWSATQLPHVVQQTLAELLEVEEHRVRVIAPDVGGGFGPKGIFYPEEAAIAVCAKSLGRPVKWIEDRLEHFTSAVQERDQHWTVEIAIDKDGRVLGIRGEMVHDAGAYVPWGIILPYIAATSMPGPYLIPSFQLGVTVVLTNKTPVNPIRGAGRPQACFAMERLLDRAARELGLDRAEIRRRNLVPPERMPYSVGLIYRDGSAMTYDSGDYPACQSRALALADYSDFPRRQAEARAAGRYLGIGLANYVEGSGYGPFEGATVRLTPTGKVWIATGAAPQGQGHRTTLAQVCAEQLGVPLADVVVITGDTGAISLGVGTFASRTAVNAGSAVYLAAQRVRDKAFRIAAHALECAEVDLVLSDGALAVKGALSRRLTWAQLARIARSGTPGHNRPAELEPGLEATAYFSPQQSTYCNGTHVAEVEVDPETGGVQFLRYTVVHDSGRLINPLIVDGQIQGGVAHGIGNALYESMQYDETGQPLTCTLADYLLPLATDVPPVRIEHMESPSPLNPIGVKGAGEGGTIPAIAAVIGAVEDALGSFGVRIAQAPIPPGRIVELIDAGTEGRAL